MEVNIYQPGQPANQPPARAAKQYLPEAVAAANAVAVILVEKYGQQPWILQCMTGIQECVQNSVQMLSGAAPQANALGLAQGGQYTQPARTAEELKATQHLVADSRTVTPAAAQQVAAQEQANQALANGQLDMFAQLQQQAGMQDPATGQVAPQQESPSEPGSDEWIVGVSALQAVNEDNGRRADDVLLGGLQPKIRGQEGQGRNRCSTS